jgi:hypothetical protein
MKMRHRLQYNETSTFADSYLKLMISYRLQLHPLKFLKILSLLTKDFRTVQCKTVLQRALG